MTLLTGTLLAAWQLLQDASLYILFGILTGGLLKVFLSPAYVARHLGRGRFRSVFKAALFGIPIPLCSCGVLPAAAALKRQGANNGATTAFLISTPESGVDSISITYALLDPIMTVARPVAAFLSAMVAGLSENLLHPPRPSLASLDRSCPVDGCCDGTDCPPELHANHHSLGERLRIGVQHAFGELWGDIAPWFFAGVLLAGLITVLVPETFFTSYLSGGLTSMLVMLAFGIPLYICATASTPIAAAMILKGVSPGTALVFLLVGPATNMASLSVLVGLLGKRAAALYLVAIAITSVACGLTLDWLYSRLGLSARAMIGQASDIFPAWSQLAATFLLLIISVPPLVRLTGRMVSRQARRQAGTSCGCDGSCADHHH